MAERREGSGLARGISAGIDGLEAIMTSVLAASFVLFGVKLLWQFWSCTSTPRRVVAEEL
jgi:hypothetical protein